MTSIVLRRWCKSVDPSDTDSKFRGFTSRLWPFYCHKSQVVFVRPASKPNPFQGRLLSAQQVEMLQLFSEVFWSISTTTPNTIHQRLPSWFNGALFCWAWLEMTFFNELGSNSLHKTCDLVSAFRQGCQIAKFTKFKKVGKFSFAQTSIAAVLRSCSNFKQRHFGVKDSKHQRVSLSEESILLACWKCERPM